MKVKTFIDYLDFRQTLYSQRQRCVNSP